MAQQKCKKCGGLVELEAILGESFKWMPSIRCYNCGEIEYPPAPIQPEPYRPQKGRTPYHQHTFSRIEVLATDD